MRGMPLAKAAATLLLSIRIVALSLVSGLRIAATARFAIARIPRMRTGLLILRIAGSSHARAPGASRYDLPRTVLFAFHILPLFCGKTHSPASLLLGGYITAAAVEVFSLGSGRDMCSGHGKRAWTNFAGSVAGAARGGAAGAG